MYIWLAHISIFIPYSLWCACTIYIHVYIYRSEKINNSISCRQLYTCTSPLLYFMYSLGASKQTTEYSHIHVCMYIYIYIYVLVMSRPLGMLPQ